MNEKLVSAIIGRENRMREKKERETVNGLCNESMTRKGFLAFLK